MYVNISTVLLGSKESKEQQHFNLTRVSHQIIKWGRWGYDLLKLRPQQCWGNNCISYLLVLSYLQCTFRIVTCI